MTQTITVRRARGADLADIDALLRRSYPKLLKVDYPPSTLVLAVPLLSRAKPELIATGTYYVAEDETGRLLGAGGWTRDRRAPGTADIRHVATDPMATRRGVGKAILTHALETAGQAGITRFNCLSTRTAVPFYASLGFEALGPVEIPLAQAIAFPAMRMVKTT